MCLWPEEGWKELSHTWTLQACGSWWPPQGSQQLRWSLVIPPLEEHLHMFHRTASGFYLWAGIFLLLKGQEVVMFFTLVELVKNETEQNKIRMNLLDCESLGTVMDLVGHKDRHRPWWITSYSRNNNCPGFVFSRSFCLSSWFLWTQLIASRQVVREHCPVTEVLKLQVRISGNLHWEVDWLTLRTLSTRLCVILWYSKSPLQGNLQTVWVRDSVSNYEIGSLYCLWSCQAPKNDS